jgi:pimeloyl-ACP methyl ester carboxylesterase
MPEIELTQGTVNYRDEGAGPAVVLIHGALVNGSLWDDVVARLSSRARCIVPDLPLGSHSIPMKRDADLSPPALAALIAELIERLDLDDVTLVGNDTGGALCQIVVARHPERIGRLLLTNCDAFENFPPASFAFAIRALQRIPGLLVIAADLGRVRIGRRLAMKTMPLTLRPIPDRLLQSWFAPLRRRAIRRDTVRVMRGIDASHTIAAVDGLRRFDRPAIVAWGLRDKFFPVADAERLADTLPQARLVRIEEARAFVPLDAPDRVAELVAELVAEAGPGAGALSAAGDSARA